MTVAEDHLMDWLRNAHAMEEQAETMLAAQADRTGDYPDLQVRIRQHLAETRGQAEKLRRCIERRGGSVSGLKDAAAKTLAYVQGLVGMMQGDEIVKGAIAAYTFEQMEIATYIALSTAAEMAGDGETAQVANDILDEEEAMADYLIDGLPELVEKYLLRAADED